MRYFTDPDHQSSLRRRSCDYGPQHPWILLTHNQFTFIGELLLPLWLLIKRVDVERWRELRRVENAHGTHPLTGTDPGPVGSA
jgi:hypothetical protein